MSYRLNIVSTLILCAQLIAHSQGSIRDTLSLDAGFWSSTYLVGTREVTREEFEGILKSASDTTICAAYQAGKSEAVTANSLYMLGACGVAVGIATKPAHSIVAFNPAGMIALVVLIGARVLEVDGHTAELDAVTRYNQHIMGITVQHGLPIPEGRGVMFSISLDL